MTRRYIRASVIAATWYAQGANCPFSPLVMDPGEPACFGCGWRTPLEADHDTFETWENWDRVGGLLEKAHLVDHCANPELDVEPLNYALLCRRCHKHMTPTAFEDGDADAAVAWVLSRVGTCHWGYQILTDEDPDWRKEFGNGRDYGRHLDRLRDELDRQLTDLPT